MNGKILSFYFDNDKQEEIIEDNNNEFFIRQICPKYLDNFHMKINTFKSAIETAINLHLNKDLFMIYCIFLF